MLSHEQTMSLQALFGKDAQRILEARTLPELQNILYEMMTSARPIEVTTPIKINNRTNSDAIQLVNLGRDDWHGISIADEYGRATTIGIGLGTTGIVANEVVPDRNFIVDPAVVNQFQQGQNVGSGYSTGSSGSGIIRRIADALKGGWGRLMDSYHQSTTTWHPPTTADQFSMNGNRKWWPTDPLGWTILRCQISAVNNDTLTCLVVDDSSGTDPAGIIGSTITVAKDCHLQRTPWDGQTINGITYTYTDSQTRTADNGVTTETQVVYPKYYPYTSSYDPCHDVYVRWVGNRTDVDSVWYIDLNTAARHWVVE